jgi:tetratricopeptide (TPR) repeat protein
MGTRQGTRNCLGLAMDIYTRVLGKSSGDLEALYGAGLVHKSMNAYEKALEMFQKVLEIGPGDFNAKLEMGLTMFLMGDLNGSMGVCKELLDVESGISDSVQALCLFQIARINWNDGIYPL